MRRLAFAIALSVSCKGGGDEPPASPPALTVEVVVDGAKTTWSRDEFERVPRLTGRNRSGESRDAWSLRAMAETMVGPGARVTSVTGRGTTISISPAEWADPARTPILHTTRRGSLKFRWAAPDGEWKEDAAVRDVTGLAIAR